MTRDNDVDDDSDGDTTDSECDYELHQSEFSGLSRKYGLPDDVVIDLWKAQRGLCRLSDLPMVFAKGHYECTIAPRVVTRPISQENAVMVCKVIEDMRQATDLPWKAFTSLLANVSKEEF